MENVQLATGGVMVWAIAGDADSTITGCRVSGQIVSTRYGVGGLVGSNYEGTIVSCSSTCTVSGQYAVGGIAGYNDGGTIEASYAAGRVSGGSLVGGLVGYCCSLPNQIRKCYSTGEVTAVVSASQGTNPSIGGLVGALRNGAIEDSYSSASITVTGDAAVYPCVGGLVGSGSADYSSTASRVAYSYSTCRITVTGPSLRFVGGLIGTGMFLPVPLEDVSWSFWDTTTSGLSISGGGTGKTTAEMMTESTFTSAWWFIRSTWMMLRPGEDYPRLVWQPVIASDVAGLYGVNAVDAAKIAAAWNLRLPAPTGMRCGNL